MLDLAWLARIATQFTGIYHAAAISQAEQINIDLYSSIFAEADSAQYWLEPLRKRHFGGATAPVTVWNQAIQRMAVHAREAGISSEVPDLITAILSRVEAAGLGKERVAAMVKILSNSHS